MDHKKMLMLAILGVLLGMALSGLYNSFIGTTIPALKAA
jgi:hypothetical protein